MGGQEGTGRAEEGSGEILSEIRVCFQSRGFRAMDPKGLVKREILWTFLFSGHVR